MMSDAPCRLVITMENSRDLTAGLNPQQKEAVEHTGVPLLIVAGAGIWENSGIDPPDRVFAAAPWGASGPDFGDHIYE